MASVAFDSKAKTYFVRFRFAGRAFKRSLSTCDRKSAYAALARAEETLMLIGNGRLEMPDDVDPAAFILSDGKRTESRQIARVATLGELCASFQTTRVPGAKEQSTIHTEDRRVEMTRMLAQVLKEWLKDHPGGLYTFAKPDDLNRGREAHSVVPINKHVARKHFKLTFRGSKWAKLRGFHVFRHSFASNLASQGVDQRIIDEWMGHQTEEMRQRYRHLLPAIGRRAIQMLMP